MEICLFFKRSRWHIFWAQLCAGKNLPEVLLFVNTLRPRQDGHPFSDDILKWIFLNENVWISLKISLMFVPKVWINNIPALVQIMAWRRPGNKPLSDPMTVNLLMNICVTWPQWVNLMLIQEHSGHVMSVSQLLIPWLLATPGAPFTKTNWF